MPQRCCSPQRSGGCRTAPPRLPGRLWAVPTRPWRRVRWRTARAAVASASPTYVRARVPVGALLPQKKCGGAQVQFLRRVSALTSALRLPSALAAQACRLAVDWTAAAGAAAPSGAGDGAVATSRLGLSSDELVGGCVYAVARLNRKALTLADVAVGAPAHSAAAQLPQRVSARARRPQCPVRRLRSVAPTCGCGARCS